MNSLLHNTEVIRVMNAVAAGTTNQNSSGVKCDDCESVTYMALFGTLTASAVTGIKIQQSDDNGVADDWTDVEGSAVAIPQANSNDMLLAEHVRPQKLYSRCVVTRGTANAVIDGVIAIKHGLRKKPGVHDSATVAGSLVLTAPAEGTA